MPAASRLRVHVLIDTLYWGGAEVLLGDLALGAPAGGLDLSVGYLVEIDRSPAAARLRRAGVEPVLVDAHGLLSPRALVRVRRHLAAVRPDVVHTHLGYSDALGGLAARSLGIPSVSTIHVLGSPVGARRTLREPVKARLMALARRHAAARVIAVSDAQRRGYLATGWDRPERVVTVRNGIARSERPADPRALRAALGLDPDAPLVTLVSVLRPGKGHDVAVEAVRQLRGRFPALGLLLVGDGPTRDEVQRLAHTLDPPAVMAGHRDDVLDILAATDVLVHPTVKDQFPTVLLEAGAAEVPVVASAVGGVPEIVVDGETGTLVPTPPTPEALAAALAPLLGDDELRRRVGAQARARFEREFTADRWAERLRSVYDEVLTEAGGRSRPTATYLSASSFRPRG